MYASAQALDFLAKTKNASFPNRKLLVIHPEFPDGHQANYFSVIAPNCQDGDRQTEIGGGAAGSKIGDRMQAGQWSPCASGFLRHKRARAAVKKTHVSEKPVAFSSGGKIFC